jgi:hypothetical protein
LRTRQFHLREIPEENPSAPVHLIPGTLFNRRPLPEQRVPAQGGAALPGLSKAGCAIEIEALGVQKLNDCYPRANLDASRASRTTR